MIGFADISHYQPTVDLDAYRRAGYDRIVMKATQGRTGVDPTFAARWRRAGELGLARGAYHFAESNDDGAADFDHFLSTVNAAGGFGPRDVPILDSEDTAAVARADEHAREFTTRAVARGFPVGLLYTGRWYADPANLRPDDLAPGWRQLWISDYGTATDDAIALPAGWSRDQIVARQYTSTATIPGVTGRCDANRVLKEWITVALTKADAELVAKALVPYLQEIATGAGNSVDDNPLLQGFRDALTAVAADVTAIRTDTTALKAAVATLKAGGTPPDPATTAAAVAPHLRIEAAQ